LRERLNIRSLASEDSSQEKKEKEKDNERSKEEILVSCLPFFLNICVEICEGWNSYLADLTQESTFGFQVV
jgi:hypothetical protein